MHACSVIDGFIFFLLQHMTWYAICMLSSWTLMNIIPMLDEIIVKRGRSKVKIFGLRVVEKSMIFGSIENFFLLKRGRSFLLDFWARCVHLYEVCFLPLLFLFFQIPKYFFWWVCQCVHQGGDCKIKGVFDYYSVMNNWHRRLLVLLFGIYSRSGFGDDWIFRWWTCALLYGYYAYVILLFATNESSWR